MLSLTHQGFFHGLLFCLMMNKDTICHVKWELACVQTQLQSK